jgi:hypothetical protein
MAVIGGKGQGEREGREGRCLEEGGDTIRESHERMRT